MAKATKSDQQRLREQIASLPVVPELRKTLFCLATGYVPEYKVPSAEQGIIDMYGNEMPIEGRPPSGPADIPRLPAVIEWRRMTKDDYGRLSLTLKTLTTIMSKLVPDLKSVDFNDVSEEQRSRLSDTELAQRINAVMGVIEAPVKAPVLTQGSVPAPPSNSPSHGRGDPEWMH